MDEARGFPAIHNHKSIRTGAVAVAGESGRNMLVMESVALHYGGN